MEERKLEFTYCELLNIFDYYILEKNTEKTQANQYLINVTLFQRKNSFCY